MPALCAVCGRPLSVRERRNCEWDPEMVCAWHAYEKMRTTFLSEERAAFWISEPSGSFKVENQHAVVIAVDAAALFGLEGDL